MTSMPVGRTHLHTNFRKHSVKLVKVGKDDASLVVRRIAFKDKTNNKLIIDQDHLQSKVFRAIIAYDEDIYRQFKQSCRVNDV
jgi:hypothetical protein